MGIGEERVLKGRFQGTLAPPITSLAPLEEIAEARLSMSDTDFRHIVKKKSRKEQAQIREISAKRNDRLEAERQARLSEEQRRREAEAVAKRAARLAAVKQDCGSGSDSDVPDLI